MNRIDTRLSRASRRSSVSWVAASFADPRGRARRGLRVVRAGAPDRARDRARGDAGGAGRARQDRVRAAAERQADDRHRADLRLRAGRRARVRGRRRGRARLQPLLRPGPVDAVADGGLGRGRRRRRRARPRRGSPARAAAARRGVRDRLAGVRGGDEPLHVGHLLGRPHARQAGGDLRDVAAVRPRPRGRQRAVLPRLRPGARARAGPLPDALRGPLGAGRGDRPAARRRGRERGAACGGRLPGRRRGGRPLRAVPAARPERRRRLGRDAGPALVAALLGLGGAGGRRGGPQPARRRFAERHRVHPRARARAERPRRAQPDDPGAARRRAPAADRRPRPRASGARPPAPRRLVRRPGEHDRRSRSSGCGRPGGREATAPSSARPTGSPARSTTTAASTSRAVAARRGSTTRAPLCRRSPPPAGEAATSSGGPRGSSCATRRPTAASR